MQFFHNTSSIFNIILLPTRIMHKLYRWTLHWSKTRYAKLSLFAVAFAESSFFPIPPDVLLIPMTVAQKYKWWLFALITTIGSVLGAVAGYYIGLTFFETIGKTIIDFYHLEKHFAVVQIKYEQNAFLAIFSAAFTPIPFKVFTIAGGVFHIPLLSLILGSILGRAGRFFIVAGILRLFGQQIADTVEKYFDIASLIFLALLIGGFLAVKFL